MSGLKLKLSIKGTGATSVGTPSATPATPATPGATPGGTARPKLKFTNHLNPSTPAAVEDVARPKKTKAGRATKPSAKILESRKRVKDETDSEADGSTIDVQPPSKKVKLRFNGAHTPATPVPAPKTPVFLKAKIKGKPPKRPPGEGYDSEASDREEDPTIEEEFILRMVPGDDCDYLRTAITEKRIGIPIAQGGPDIKMKFFHAEGRRAMVTIRGHMYAATLVDLPCVIEGMKSWDRRGWWKSADICQMLWVFAPVRSEEEAKTIALPDVIDDRTFQYPHGLTAPMHYARKRRFRKRISRTAIEAVEEAVDKLLQADSKADRSTWEMIEPDTGNRAEFSPDDSEDGYGDGQDEYSEDEDADADAEGEADDYFSGAHGAGQPVNPLEDDGNAALAADLEAAFEEESLGVPTPASNPAVTPSMMDGGETPIKQEAGEDVEEGELEEDDSGDESLEDDEEDAADDDEKVRLAQLQATREDIADLERQIQLAQNQSASQTNAILKKRAEEQLKRLKTELELKKSSIGEGEEGDDDD